VPIVNRIEREVTEQISLTTSILLESELLLDSNGVVRDESRGSIILAWQQDPHLSYLFGEFSRLSHYLESIRRRDYNFCLSDGSFIQIYYQIEGDEIAKHRLCYYPCPFDIEQSESEDYGLLDYCDLIGDLELRSRLRLVSPIRFDFDSRLADFRHHYSHVTTLKSSCRIPAYGPISVGHFMRFILTHFYQESLMEPSLEELDAIMYVRTLHSPPGHEMFLESSVR
jgi:hypothetical protein